MEMDCDRNWHDIWALIGTLEKEAILGWKAKWLVARPHVSVIIQDHCDERGTFEGNIVLGALESRDMIRATA